MESSPPSDSEAMRSPRVAGRGLGWTHLTRPERRRLALALWASLLIHALVLSLNFGGQGLGFPGFGFPWRDRRVEVAELRVVLAPLRVAAARPAATAAAEPLQLATIKPPVPVGPVHGPSVSPSQGLRQKADTHVRKADQPAGAMPQQDFATSPADAKAPLRANGPSDAAPAPIPEPHVIDLKRPDEAAFAVPPSPSVPSPVVAAALSASSPKQLEEARVEAARLEAERQEAVRLPAAQEETERREAARRAMGRQLDAEAAQREAASTATLQPDTRPYSLSTARRGRLLGRTHPNSELLLYAEAWALRIQFNTPFDVVREVTKRPHVDPLVTVAIRRDGSVESVTFVLSSGVTEIDEAIRRIVQSQVPYQPFQLGLAREFDVIEIRRTWHFDVAVRLD